MAAIDATELNGNGAYPRAGTRDACMQQGIEQEQEQAGSAVASPSSGISPREREAKQHAAAHAASFAAIVAPLEAGREPLNGSGRQACLAAFDESPEGFERIAGEALERGRMNPLGLLCRMVRDRDHLKDGRPARREPASSGPPAPRKSSRCSSCGSVPLAKDERLIIVGKDVGKALSAKASDTCGICGESLRPGAKGTIGDLGRLNPRGLDVDELAFAIEWSHAECLRDDREVQAEHARERSGSQNREAGA
jgi:hypothetical protein